jgi:hypothetical protein
MGNVMIIAFLQKRFLIGLITPLVVNYVTVPLT